MKVIDNKKSSHYFKHLIHFKEYTCLKTGLIIAAMGTFTGNKDTKIEFDWELE